MIHMTHPNLPVDQVPAGVTEQAFQLVWHSRGWELVTDAAPDQKLAADPEPPAKSTTPTARAKKENIR